MNSCDVEHSDKFISLLSLVNEAKVDIFIWS